MVNIGGSEQRNVGIDLIKIICMFMILILHVISSTKLIDKAELFILNYNILKFMITMSTCAVDCFALITGYIYFDIKFKYNRIINLWFQVLFYTISITLLTLVFNPADVGVLDIIRMFFPVMGCWYWYFMAYFGLFFIIPFLNIFLRQVCKDTLKKLIFTLVIVFSVFYFIPFNKIFTRDNFGLNYGYSMTWLVMLYILGAALKIFKIEKYVSKKLCILVYLLLCILGFLGRMTTDFVTLKYLGKITKYNNFLLEYTSPIVLLMAVSLFLLCIKIDFKDGCISKIIIWFASTSFAVYLIHHHKFFMRWLTRSEWILSIADLPACLMITMLMVMLFEIYVVCSLIDYLRTSIFKILKIRLLSERIENLFRFIFRKVKNVFFKNY